MIVSDNVLKIWIELIKSRNDITREKFYSLRTFQKLIILVEISKISKILEKMKICRGRRFCSTSYPSGNQVNGPPLVAIRKQWLSRADLSPHKMVHYHLKMIELSFFPWMTLRKVHRKRGSAYVEDQLKCDKMWKRQCKRRAIEVPDFRKFRKN